MHESYSQAKRNVIIGSKLVVKHSLAELNSLLNITKENENSDEDEENQQKGDEAFNIEETMSMEQYEAREQA